MSTFTYTGIGIQTLDASSFQEILPFSEILNFSVFLDIRHANIRICFFFFLTISHSAFISIDIIS